MLNRVTKDIMTIDQEVLDMITMVARSVASVLGSLVLILVFLPTFIIPTAVLGQSHALPACGRSIVYRPVPIANGSSS